MSLLDPMKTRLTRDLEPILALPDPRTKLSAYHDMPYAIFRYDPGEEFDLRREVGMLETRLTQRGKRVARVSLAECLDDDPLRDIVFIVRTGALFPVYRTFSLLEQLKGRVQAPAVLFYPGDLDGASGLRFMGVLDAEHNYRPKIF
ncbi:MAG: DUF1788 domain-containing protein [Chloroflexi bacterium]|nr:DUF1788 domain-containing protein [Chloroflexota bacterium]